ncbi:hypothetical protein BJX62DRAFT_240988 [Aspergillus germanicus]
MRAAALTCSQGAIDPKELLMRLLVRNREELEKIDITFFIIINKIGASDNTIDDALVALLKEVLVEEKVSPRLAPSQRRDRQQAEHGGLQFPIISMNSTTGDMSKYIGPTVVILKTRNDDGTYSVQQIENRRSLLSFSEKRDRHPINVTINDVFHINGSIDPITSETILGIDISGIDLGVFHGLANQTMKIDLQLQALNGKIIVELNAFDELWVHVDTVSCGMNERLSNFNCKRSEQLTRFAADEVKLVVGTGVVQYDMGKLTNDGFITTASLKAPTEKLLHVLNYMPLHGSPITGQVDIEYPGAGLDQLFKASYPHVGGDTCETCDREQTVQRSILRDSTTPHVFYGTIASGKSVFKDSKTSETTN